MASEFAEHSNSADSVAAVAISMWLGIQTSFYFAVAAYALVAVPAALLWQRAATVRVGVEDSAGS